MRELRWTLPLVNALGDAVAPVVLSHGYRSRHAAGVACEIERRGCSLLSNAALPAADRDVLLGKLRVEAGGRGRSETGAALAYWEFMPRIFVAFLSFAAALAGQDHTAWRDYGGASDSAQYSALRRSHPGMSASSKSPGRIRPPTGGSTSSIR